jgi:hypothetical protein
MQVACSTPRASIMAKRCVKLAALLPLLFSPCYCQGSIYSGEGFATYYYDIEQPDSCSTSVSTMNSGLLKCGLSADAIDSNHIVAINLTQLSSDMTLCGKQVIVSVNDKVSTLPLFVGDGCGRCASGSASSEVWNSVAAPGLDLSYSALNELADGAACAGPIRITWEIRDVLLYDFNSNAAKSQQGPATLGTSALVVPTSTSSVCTEGSWQCSSDNDVLEQCLGQIWVPRATCPAEYICKGDATPYCV